MQALVSAVVAVAGAVGEDFDPTTQPSRGSLYVFLFLAAATILLVLSFLRHLRRAQSVKPSQQPVDAGQPPADVSEDDPR